MIRRWLFDIWVRLLQTDLAAGERVEAREIGGRQ